LAALYFKAMTYKADSVTIAMVAISVIIALCVITIICIIIFGTEAVYPIFMEIFRNKYSYGLFAIFLVIPLNYFRRGLAKNNRYEWLKRYGVTSEKVTREAYCNKFNLVSNMFLNIYHITGSDKLGKPLEVYVAVDREWSVKDIIWVTKPIKV
jgi:hypothetical protein